MGIRKVLQDLITLFSRIFLVKNIEKKPPKVLASPKHPTYQPQKREIELPEVYANSEELSFRDVAHNGKMPSTQPVSTEGEPEIEIDEDNIESSKSSYQYQPVLENEVWDQDVSSLGQDKEKIGEVGDYKLTQIDNQIETSELGMINQNTEEIETEIIKSVTGEEIHVEGERKFEIQNDGQQLENTVDLVEEKQFESDVADAENDMEGEEEDVEFCTEEEEEEEEDDDDDDDDGVNFENENDAIFSVTESVNPQVEKSIIQRVKITHTPGKHPAHRNVIPFNQYLVNQAATSLHEVSDKDVEKLLKNLASDNNEEIFTWDVPKLENHIYKAFAQIEFIGDLPISEEMFAKLCNYIRANSLRKGKKDPRQILPCIFLISMVFCARYSDTDARDFWQPYMRLVWGRDATEQYFTKTCRDLFIYSREFVEKNLHLSFNFDTSGDVVRPVYQHAIIPSYLQIYFAEWIIKNLETLVHFSAEQLPIILSQEKSLKSVPPRLRNFIRNEQTKRTAARLITQMSYAIQLFRETDQADAVESVMSSPIERSLWQAIYKALLQEHSARLRNITPRLEWCWNTEDDELYLNLSGVHAEAKEKPDSVIWVPNNTENLNQNSSLVKVSPWKTRAGDWEVDTIHIPSSGPLNGSILVLSEEYDMERGKQDQPSHIIFEREVPIIPKQASFFKILPHRRYTQLKESIDSNGTWIILSKKPIHIFQADGTQVQCRGIALPPSLHKAGINHAVVANVQLPIQVESEDFAREFANIEIQNGFGSTVHGKDKFTTLSLEVSPVYNSPKVSFAFQFDPEIISLRQTWLLIRQNGEFSLSILLADIAQKGFLTITDNKCEIALEPFISQPGSFNLLLLYNMRPLFEDPIQFAWIPDNVEITEPDINTCYSPVNPLTVSIKGLEQEKVIPFSDEKCKISSENGKVLLEWKNLHGSHCRYAINWEGFPIQLCWDVRRVSAWIEGGGDKEQVNEDQDQKVIVYLRGNPKEKFIWELEENELSRSSSLNAKGEYSEKLAESVLWDMLKQGNFVRTQAKISIAGYSWKVFDYYRQPNVVFSNIEYKKPELKINLDIKPKLYGSYSVKIKQVDDISKELVLEKKEMLDDELVYKIELIPGEYRAELYLFDNVIASSNNFQVKEVLSEKFTLFHEVETGSPEHLFVTLTANGHELFSEDFEGLPIAPTIHQLQLIHNPKEWLTDDAYEDCFKRLLPSWAVLRFPLRFTTQLHNKILHVFPEQIAYGGKAGRGYVELKIEGVKLRVAAAWRPSKYPQLSELWMGIPQLQNTPRFCEIDPGDLWPAYQCVGCGEIVATRSGTCLKLPPSILQEHRHGKNLPILEHFIDTVYDRHILVRISQYEETSLIHTYMPENVVIKGYLGSLFDGKVREITGDLSKPIDLYKNVDYICAISELFKHIRKSLNSSQKNYFLAWQRGFQQIRSYMDGRKDQVPAFYALSRLGRLLYESQQPLNIPGDVLTFCMAIRLRANVPQEYARMISLMEIPERSIFGLVSELTQFCPKLLEWGIAWSELFYIHAIS